MKTQIILLLFLPFQIFSQVSLTGTIRDAETNQPVVFATVYINGTMNGTMTNQSGDFSLENVVDPCQIVCSHVSYKTTAILFSANQSPKLNILLTPKNIEIKEVKVSASGKNQWKENLKYFKDHFLGEDRWGRNAVIKNEGVLRFHKDYDIHKDDHNAKGNKAEIRLDLYHFIATASEPLKISLPLLGYELYLDLVQYSEWYNQNNDAYSFELLGYYYFKSVIEPSNSDTSRITNNRLKAYYNSSQHFLKSLFEKRLKENGYLLKEWVPGNPYGGMCRESKLDSCLQYSGNELKIIGLKGKMFLIEYYKDSKDYPLNLAVKNSNKLPINSNLFILSDTCIIRDNGTLPSNSMTFGEFFGEKRVGASLPNDYKPEE